MCLPEWGVWLVMLVRGDLMRVVGVERSDKVFRIWLKLIEISMPMPYETAQIDRLLPLVRVSFVAFQPGSKD